MKITSKVMLVNFEDRVKIGPAGCVEVTLIHQAVISESATEPGAIAVDLEYASDIEDVTFHGMKIEQGYKEYKKFCSNAYTLGIDVPTLIVDAVKTLEMNRDDKGVLARRFMHCFV